MTRPRLLLIVGLLFSAAFLWLALRSIDIAAVLDALARGNLFWSLPFLAALAVFCWVKAARWAILLEGLAPATGGALLSSVVIGYAATTLMPLQLGEIVRAYTAARKLDIAVAPALSSIALERVLDALALVILLAVVLLLGAEVGSGLRQAGAWVSVLAVVALTMLSWFAMRPEQFQRMIAVVTRPLPAGAQRVMTQQLLGLAQGLAVLRRPSRYAALVGMSALQWSCMFGCAWFTLQVFALDLPATAALLILVTTLLGMSLPAGPAYLGTIQLAFLTALAPFGVSRENAIAASIVYHALLCVPLLLWGAYYVLRSGMSPVQLRRAAHSVINE